MDRLKTSTVITTNPANPLFARRGTFQIKSEKAQDKWGATVPAETDADGNPVMLTMSVIAANEQKAGKLM